LEIKQYQNKLKAQARFGRVQFSSEFSLQAADDDAQAEA
jgi:hypothetical protein